MTYISSTSLLAPMRQSVLQVQAGLAQAQTEITTGVLSDVGLGLGARTGTTVSLKNQADALDSYGASNAVASIRLDTTATKLTAMVTAAQSMSQALITASTAGAATAGLQASASTNLQALLSGLNTAVDGQYVFGGINSGVQPVTDYAAGSGAKTAVDAAFERNFGVAQSDAGASTISGDAMRSFLDGSFDALFGDAQWSADWSKASDTAQSTTVAPGQAVTTSVGANAAAFRQIAEAYAMVREFTGTTMSADAKAAVIAKATALVNTGLAALNDIQTSVGAAQNAVTSANTGLSAQATLLKGQASSMESVDTYALAARVSTLQTQLQASYQLTAQLQKLSLVNYISG